MGAGLRILARREVVEILNRSSDELLPLIRRAYLSFGSGDVVNPHSAFLRLPEPLGSRIIALPAAIMSGEPAVGIKWIASFPENIHRDLERASAVVVLNDPSTGYPVAILEGAAISAWRTALSACLVGDHLIPSKSVTVCSLIGCGLISRRTLDVFLTDQWQIGEVGLYDVRQDRAERLATYIRRRGIPATVCPTAEEAVRRAELIVFATTETSPWFFDRVSVSHKPTILHLSLRDLGPELLMECWNIVDDVEHALRAGTSLALSEKEAGHRNFIAGDVAALLAGRIGSGEGATTVFSPFGLGMLDVALARHVADVATSSSMGILLEDFFIEDDER